LVTSHLLGELERTCDHVVVVDGGKLLRSSSTTDFTQTTTTLAIEVTDNDEHPDGTRAVREALHARGIETHDGSGLPGAGHILLLTTESEDTYDLVRDLVADLGLGLVRMEQRRHHIAEVFNDSDEQRTKDERAASTDPRTGDDQRKEAVGHGS
ncbi:ABC transporter ATP-binding protein, partial [Streptomyces anthocyanicus]